MPIIFRYEDYIKRLYDDVRGWTVKLWAVKILFIPKAYKKYGWLENH